MKRLAIALAVIVCASCTTRYQVRGIEHNDRVFDLDTFAGREPEKKILQETMEHQSVERFTNFTLGIIEVADDGSTNPEQKRQVMSMVEDETANGGLLIVLVHGWHHGARTCDRDLCCFRRVLDELQKGRRAIYPKENVVGVYVGWRGESLAVPKLNVFTLHERKHVAERIGRTTGKEILMELQNIWLPNENLTMVTAGHSLGGAFVFQAMKGKLTGNVADLYQNNLKDYRITRAKEDREAAAARHRKAQRAELGDLVVLINPAIEADVWLPFDNDLPDKNAPANLVAARLPYDKNLPYSPEQLPILMTVASRADTAVGRFFPAFKFVGYFFTLRWWKFFQPQEWHGLGRYSPQMTHNLTHGTESVAGEEEKGTTLPPKCDCPFGNYRDEEMVPRGAENRFDLVNTGAKRDFNGYQWRLTPQFEARGWDDRAPYFVVSTDQSVISEHSDIFNRRFVGFLVQFVDAYDQARKAAEAKGTQTR